MTKYEQISGVKGINGLKNIDELVSDVVVITEITTIVVKTSCQMQGCKRYINIFLKTQQHLFIQAKKKGSEGRSNYRKI